MVILNGISVAQLLWSVFISTKKYCLIYTSLIMNVAYTNNGALHKQYTLHIISFISHRPGRNGTLASDLKGAGARAPLWIVCFKYYNFLASKQPPGHYPSEYELGYWLWISWIRIIWINDSKPQCFIKGHWSIHHLIHRVDSLRVSHSRLTWFAAAICDSRGKDGRGYPCTEAP